MSETTSAARLGHRVQAAGLVASAWMTVPPPPDVRSDLAVRWGRTVTLRDLRRNGHLS